MTSVFDLANWFLSQESMTHKKLQKLSYYAQAWYCTLYDGSPLFKDDIQAWVHGPVIPSLYDKYSNHQWQLIPKVEFDDSILSEDVYQVLESVFCTYGDLTGAELESLTHSEDPWIIAREGIDPWVASTNSISIESMRDFYTKQYELGQND